MGAETTYYVRGLICETRDVTERVSAVTMHDAEMKARKLGITNITWVKHWSEVEEKDE